MDTQEDGFLIKIIQNFHSLLVTTDFNDSQVILSHRLLLTFVLKLSKCILLINTAFQLKAWKKYLLLKWETLAKRQLPYDICSFCLIVAYRLKSVLLFISVRWMSFFLFKLYVDRSYIKVKFMHNLLKLAPIYHLKRANNLLQVFIFSEKKSVRLIRLTELLK